MIYSDAAHIFMILSTGMPRIVHLIQLLKQEKGFYGYSTSLPISTYLTDQGQPGRGKQSDYWGYHEGHQINNKILNATVKIIHYSVR